MVAAARGGATLVVCDREWAFEPEVTAERRDWYAAHPPVGDWFPHSSRVTADEFCRAVLDDPGMNRLGEPSAVLLDRGVASRFGPFNCRLAMICDTEYWTRIASHDGFVHVPEALVCFRVHGRSASASLLDARSHRIALDGLILQHDLALAPIYEPLRRAARTLDPPPDLVGRLREQAQSAWRRVDPAAAASCAGDDGSHLDAGSLRDWLTMARQYPMIHRLATGRWLDDEDAAWAKASS
jgi:hypothetical protein